MRLIRLVAGLDAILAPSADEPTPAAVVGEPSHEADDSAVEPDSASAYKTGKRWSNASPSAPVERVHEPLTTFVSRETSFRIRLPATWRSRTAESGGAPPAIVFQIPTPSGSAGRFAMSVSIGTRDGRITLCTPECVVARVHSLDDLAATLDSLPDLPRVRDRVRDISLDGAPGRLEAPGPTPYTLCFPDAMYHAFAIHDGRPVVLRINYCRMQSHELSERGDPSDLVTRMLASFRLLD
jgi:hypothetical protein